MLKTGFGFIEPCCGSEAKTVLDDFIQDVLAVKHYGEISAKAEKDLMEIAGISLSEAKMEVERWRRQIEALLAEHATLKSSDEIFYEAKAQEFLNAFLYNGLKGVVSVLSGFFAGKGMVKTGDMFKEILEKEKLMS